MYKGMDFIDLPSIFQDRSVTSSISDYFHFGNDVTSPLMTDSQHQPYCQNGCYLAEYIVYNILKKTHGRKFDKK